MTLFFFLDQSISRSIKHVTAIVYFHVVLQVKSLYVLIISKLCMTWCCGSLLWDFFISSRGIISLTGCVFFPRQGWHFFWYWLLRGRGSPERASFTLSCPTWNRSSSGGKLRSSGALTPPPAWKDLLNLIAHGRYLEGLPTLPFTVISAAHKTAASLSPAAVSNRELYICLTPADSCPLCPEPWISAPNSEKYYYIRNVCLVIWTGNVSD